MIKCCPSPSHGLCVFMCVCSHIVRQRLCVWIACLRCRKESDRLVCLSFGRSDICSRLIGSACLSRVDLSLNTDMSDVIIKYLLINLEKRSCSCWYLFISSTSHVLTVVWIWMRLKLNVVFQDYLFVVLLFLFLTELLLYLPEESNLLTVSQKTRWCWSLV